MKLSAKIIIITILIAIFTFYRQAYAHSTRHHLIDTGKNLVKCCLYPLHGIFIKGPQNIKAMYQYEVYGLEKPEKRGHLHNKIVASWQAIGEEGKGIIDGLATSVKAGGESLKEFISIFFGD